MANLTSVQIKDSYQSVLTTSETTSNPTTGTLQNGKGTAITALTVSGALTLTGDLTVDTNSLEVDSANNRVGIGRAGAFVGSERLHIGFNSSGAQSQGVNLRDGNASASGSIFSVYRKSDDTFLGLVRRMGTDNAILLSGNSYLALGSDNTERMRITASGVLELTQGQIKFPATQVASADANTLDDYEEGTWTPAGNGITFTTPEGHYTKIGNVVTVVARVTFPNTANASSALIQGLPFTGKDNMTAGSIGLTNYGSSDIIVTQAGASFLIRTYSNVILTNANLSEKFIYCSATYNI